MWKVRPAHSCFGCFTLTLGVEVTCFITLLAQILIISLCSSSEPLALMSLKVSPTVQVLCASWALVGIPMVICAGVGVLYHVDHLLRAFFWYLLFSLPLGIAVPTWLLASGKVCSSVVEDEVQRLGPAFVCGFTESFVFMWMMVAGLVQCYLVYVVWSAAAEISKIPNNSVALTAYANKLQFLASMGLSQMDSKSVPVLNPGYNPFSSLLSEGSRSYGAASHPADAEGAATGRSARSARSAHSAVSARSTGGGGNPQSFFPTPASNFKSEVAKEPAPQEPQQDAAESETPSKAKSPDSAAPGAPQSFFPTPPSNMDFKSTA